MSKGRTTGNTAPGLTSVTALFTTWSFITYIIRCWVKRRRSDSWGIDDTLISVAFVAIIFHVFTVCRAIAHGYGNEWYTISDHDQVVIEKMLYASQILYYFTLGMTKTSLGFFNVRLILQKWHRRLTQALIAITITWTICAILIISLRENLTSPWAMDGSDTLWHRWLGIEVAGLIIEITLWAVSVYGVGVLNLALEKKVSTAAIFSVRLAIVPVVVLRLYYLSPSKSSNLPVPDILVSVYTEIAVQAAFMLASVICIRPFLQPFDPGYFVAAQLPYTKSPMFPSKHHNVSGGAGTGGVGTSNSTSTRNDAYHMLSAISNSSGSKTRSQTQTWATSTPSALLQTTDSHQDTINDYDDTDTSSTSCACVAKPPPTFSPVESYYQVTCSAHDASRQNSVALEPGQMAIAVRESWSVTIEEQNHEEREDFRSKSVAVATSPPMEIYEQELGLEFNGVRI